MDAKYNLQQVADYFISFSNETGDGITNLKLQKLVYYAQAWYLGMTDNALFVDDFQAWVHGPVVPDLYHQYKKFSWQAIQRPDLVPGSYKKIEQSFDQETQAILFDIRAHYAAKGAYELELLTHREEPWIITRGGRPEDEPCTEVIPKEIMLHWADAALYD